MMRIVALLVLCCLFLSCGDYGAPSTLVSTKQDIAEGPDIKVYAPFRMGDIAYMDMTLGGSICVLCQGVEDPHFSYVQFRIYGEEDWKDLWRLSILDSEDGDSYVFERFLSLPLYTDKLVGQYVKSEGGWYHYIRRLREPNIFGMFLEFGDGKDPAEVWPYGPGLMYFTHPLPGWSDHITGYLVLEFRLVDRTYISDYELLVIAI